MSGRYLILLLVPLLSQCASLRFAWQDCAAHPPPLGSSLWTQPFSGLHQLTRDGEQSVLMAVRRDDQGLAMQALDPLGLELFRLGWRDGQLHSSGPDALIQQFDMALLVADFQLVHWPLAVLQRAWQISPWQVQQQGAVRSLLCGGVRVSEVRYPPMPDRVSPIILSNLLAGYRLEILNLDPPSPARHE